MNLRWAAFVDASRVFPIAATRRCNGDSSQSRRGHPHSALQPASGLRCQHLQSETRLVLRRSSSLPLPARERIRKIAPVAGYEVLFLDEAGIEFDADLAFIHRVAADEDDLLAFGRPR